MMVALYGAGGTSGVEGTIGGVPHGEDLAGNGKENGLVHSDEESDQEDGLGV